MRILLASLALLAVAAAQANLLVNGSFELPGLGVGQYPSIPGWTVGAGSLGTTIETAPATSTYGVTGQDLTYVLELDSNGNTTVEQTFNLASATTLNVSFLYALRAGTAPATNAFDVLLNGNVIASFTPTSTVMTAYAFSGAGLAGANTIAFAATGGVATNDSLGGIIDNVSVVAAPAPGAALAFAIGALRRRRRA